MTTHDLTALVPHDAEAEAPQEVNVNLAAFKVGQDEMVLDIMRIREILKPVPVTPLPRAPEGIRGIIHVRGVVMPLVDVAVKFGLPPQDDNPRRRIMVVLDRKRLWGLQVDQVDEVVRVPKSRLKTGVGIFSGQALHVFSGVVEHNGRLLLLLNLARFLATDTPVSIPALPLPSSLAELP